jgi:hypothetical protein
VGADIRGKIVGVPFLEVKLKKFETVKSLLSLEKGFTVDNMIVLMKYSKLFNRLIVFTERLSEMAPYFAYELTPQPASLYKDGMMHKPDKAALGRLITTGA